MPLISGTLRDFGFKSFPGQYPTITFEANEPAVTRSGAILSTKPIKVTPDAAGDWSVTLAGTDNLATGNIWYKITVNWLDDQGRPAQMDYPDWRLFVPAKGGDLADMLEKPANPSLVYIGLTAPLHPTPGMKWLDTNPDGTAGTGNLYEWSN